MQSTTNTRNDVYNIITERIIEQLQKGIVPWKKSWSGAGTARNLSSHRAYHGFNAMFLGMFGFDNPHFVTLKQCNALGGSINKGEKGLPVVYWKVSYRSPEGKYFDGSKLTASQRAEYTKHFLLRYYKVWNVKQCTGLEAHIPAPLQKVNNPIDSAEQIVSHFQNMPSLAHGGDRAYYSPSQDHVQMPTMNSFDTAEAYYATLFHELIHSTGHQKRLERKGVCDRTATFGSCEYSKEELIAELGSCFLNNEAGFLNDALFENAAAYIQNWIEVLQNDPKMVVMASTKAQAAADYILNVKSETATEENSVAA